MKGHGRLRVKSWWKLLSFMLLFMLTCYTGVYALAPATQANPAELVIQIGAAPTGAQASSGAVPVLSKGLAADSAEGAYVSAQRAASPAPKASPSAAPAASPSPSPSVSPAKKQSPTATPDEPAKTQAPQGNTDLPYYLYFEKGSFTLTIYELDANGEYTKVYKTYRAAHGGNKTPAGTFTIGAKERWHEFPDGGFVQFASRFHARLYIHSPLYGRENAGVMWPKYYDGELGIGKTSTGGCLRLVTEAARFIYEKCPEGTVFEIVNGSPKNTTSDEPPSRNGKRYDPTDVEMTG